MGTVKQTLEQLRWVGPPMYIALVKDYGIIRHVMDNLYHAILKNGCAIVELLEPSVVEMPTSRPFRIVPVKYPVSLSLLGWTYESYPGDHDPPSDLVE